MRIIGGSAKGRRIKAGRDYSIRPTADKVRESVFDILQGKIDGRVALDLFAGTGALGIEALSRGASTATFVDSGRDAIDLIRQNLEITGFTECATIKRLELPKQLKRIGADSRRYDLVFLDPPYGKGLVDSTIEELERLDLIETGVILVAEHSAREAVRESFQAFQLIHRRVYSAAAVSFYERAL